jgi:hypothetical protein
MGVRGASRKSGLLCRLGLAGLRLFLAALGVRGALLVKRLPWQSSNKIKAIRRRLAAFRLG